MNRITVFTPAYNRGYTLGRLADSLLAQTNHHFDWLVIDDGSQDNTEEIIKSYIDNDPPFKITYQKIKNGGKQRAINRAVKQIESEFTFIVDSDDFLTEEAIDKVLQWTDNLPAGVAGVAGVRANGVYRPIAGEPSFDGDYVEITNLERKLYNMQADMAEVYRTSILKKYPFKVWEGETFVPESTVWNQIALDGYPLRWYKDIIYVCEYLDDGLTKGSWNLLKKNPMGYAMMYNHFLLTEKTGRFNIVVQMISCLCLGHNLKLVFKSNAPFFSVLCVPIGIVLYIRRRNQLKKIGS